VRVNNLRLKSCVCSILAAAAVSSSAYAQEKVTTLEEIVVTAQKRSESLQDVSIAISAFTGETRDLLGLGSATEIVNFTPGVTLGVAVDRLTVRGIGRNSNSQAVDPGVANYVDNFYLSTTLLAGTSQLFIDRVEILRGPQGTLYGRNSIGGAVNAIAKRPSSEPNAEIRYKQANYQRHDLEARASTPITDWLRVSVGAGSYNQDDPFIKNVGGAGEFGVRQDTYLEGQIAANFGDAVDVWAKVHSSTFDRYYGGVAFVSAFPYYTGPGGSPFGPNPNTVGGASISSSSIPLYPNPQYNSGIVATTGAVPHNASPLFTSANPTATNRQLVDHNTPQTETLKDNVSAVLEVVGHLGFADLKYTGGYFQYNFTDTFDADNSSRTSYSYLPINSATPITIDSSFIYTYNDHKQYYSNEFDLLSTGDGAIQWVGGVYQYHESYGLPVKLFSKNQPQVRSPFGAAPNPEGNFLATDMAMVGESIAGFGQIDWRFTDTWKATLGARYTKDKKHGEEFRRVVVFDPTSDLGFLSPFLVGAVGALDVTSLATGGTRLADGRVQRHLEGEWSGVTGTAGIEWKPVDHALGYLKYTRGYKSGGINAGELAAAPYTDPEHINAYELGWKQDIGGRLQANVAAFYYDYKGSQIPLAFPTNTTPAVVVYNIDQKLYGVELETIWRPFDSLQVMANYAYLHSAIGDSGICYQDGANTVANVGPKPCVGAGGFAGQLIDGNKAPRAPENKASLNLLYTVELSPGSLALSGSYIWVDKQYVSVFTRPEYLMPSYGQADFRATWTDTGNNYSFVAYLKNAWNTVGYDDAGVGVNGFTAGGVPVVQTNFAYTLPRTYGLEVQFRFGATKK